MPLSVAGFRRRWVLFVAAGETAGFAVPSLAGGVAWWLDAPWPALYVMIVVAGAGEGFVLGFAQYRAVHPYLRSLPGRRWVGVTGVAAAVAWAIGMVPGALHDAGAPGRVVAGVWVVAAAMILLSIPMVQWWVLRAHVRGAGLWIAANVLAWGAGVPIPFVALGLVPDEAPAAAFVAAGIASGFAMALLVAIVTGEAMWRLLREIRAGTRTA